MAKVSEFFADLLRSRWVGGLNKVTHPTITGIESWLTTGPYSWIPSPPGIIKLDVAGVTEPLAEAIASEISRFACAAYESVLDAGPGKHADRSLGWALVRYYYATFYAAHALLRISGKSITMIGHQTALTLNAVGGQYLGISPGIGGGLHVVQADHFNRSRITIRKIGGTGGGSHEEMWKQFLILLLELEDELILTQGQSQDALATAEVLIQLRALLCHQGKNGGSWLSSVRNDLTYRHQHGVWYPYKMTEKAAAALMARMLRWTPASTNGYVIGKANDELSSFVDACNVMTRLLTAALSDLSSRAAKTRNSFVDRRPFKLLRLRSVAV